MCAKIDELTVEQLDHLTAEHIMNLPMDSIDNYMVFEGETWRPTLNGTQALEVFKRMAHQSINEPMLEFNSCTGWSVFGRTFLDKTYRVFSTEDTPGKAICRAALKVVGYDG